MTMKQRMYFLLMFYCLLAFSSSAAIAQSSKPILREEHKIVVNGVEEVWRLEWMKPPSPACGPENDDWVTCPCTGFAFGEWGDLRLVRKRPGKMDEQFSLNRLFEYGELPAKPYNVSGAVLRRWDVLDEDSMVTDSKKLANRVRGRSLAKVMHFADYDHDGRATEFALQIGTEPCGKKTCVVVGTSRKNDRLHVFSSVKRPKEPLILTSWQWEALSNTKGPVRVIDWRCGDHASEEEREVELRAQNGDIYATRRTYECVDRKGSGFRERLLKAEDF